MALSVEIRAQILRRTWKCEDLAGDTCHALDAIARMPEERKHQAMELIHAGRAMDLGVMLVALVAEDFGRRSFKQAEEEAAEERKARRDEAVDAEIDRRIEAARFAGAGLAA